MQEQPKTVDKPEKVGLVKQLIALLKGEKVELIHRDGDDDRREVPTQAGDILVYTGDLTTGTAVNILEEDGTETAAPDDTYELAEGDVIVVEDGIVIEITSKELIDNDMELQKQVENLQKTVDDFLKGVNDKEVALESAKKEKAAEAKFTEMSEKIVTLTEVVTEFTKSDVTPPAQKPSQSTEKVPSWKKKLDNITR